MAKQAVTRKVVVCEALGFLAVIVLLWVNELFDLPNLLFRTGPTPINWAECILESAAVAFLAFLVLVWSQLFLGRTKPVEGFVPVCRYCGKIRVVGQWMTFEAYTTQYGHEAAAQGVCDRCAERSRSIEASAAKPEK